MANLPRPDLGQYTAATDGFGVLPRIDLGQYAAAADEFGRLPRPVLLGDPPLDYLFIGSGGARSGGSAIVRPQLTFIAGGGLCASGRADIAGQPFVFDASGGMVAGGHADAALISLLDFQMAGSGGLLAGGQAVAEKIPFRAAGGARLSGAATITFTSPLVTGTVTTDVGAPWASSIVFFESVSVAGTLPLGLESIIEVAAGGLITIDAALPALQGLAEGGRDSEIVADLPGLASEIAVVAGVLVRIDSALVPVASAIEVRSGAAALIEGDLPIRLTSSVQVLCGGVAKQPEGRLPISMRSEIAVVAVGGVHLDSSIPAPETVIALHRIGDVVIDSNLPRLTGAAIGRRVA